MILGDFAVFAHALFEFFGGEKIDPKKFFGAFLSDMSKNRTRNSMVSFKKYTFLHQKKAFLESTHGWAPPLWVHWLSDHLFGAFWAILSIPKLLKLY